MLLHPFRSQDNPEGYVLIAVAENKLHSDAFAHRMQEALARPLPDWVMNYTMWVLRGGDGQEQERNACIVVVAGARQGAIPSEVHMHAGGHHTTGAFKHRRMTGDPRLQEVLAALLRHTFLKGFEVRAGDLVISNGVTPLLDHLFFTLADAGEGVLIPAPYYPSFDMDLMVSPWGARGSVSLQGPGGGQWSASSLQDHPKNTPLLHHPSGQGRCGSSAVLPRRRRRRDCPVGPGGGRGSRGRVAHPRPPHHQP